MKTEKYTIEQVKTTLEGTGGLIALAAAQLGCSRATVYNYIKRYPELEEVVNGEREKLIEEAIVGLRAGIGKGEPWAVCFTLKTLGKDWGFSERTEHRHTGEDGGPIRLKAETMTDDELAAIASRSSLRIAQTPSGKNGTS